MTRTDLHSLPRVSDGWTFLYAEHARVEREDGSITVYARGARTRVPVAMLACLLLGPGSSVTHAALATCAESGCSVVFTGEGGVRCYAANVGETRSAANLMEQARHWADESLHLSVVRRMYRMRFEEVVDESLSVEQIRGMEGARVRRRYAELAKETGVEWTGRRYGGEWSSSTPANRALSTANACLYGLCHAAIVSMGFSPGLGFVHTGKALSFVYDVADLYKMETTVPAAFRASVSAPLRDLESATRRACRDAFRETRLLECVVRDLHRLFGLGSVEPRLVDLAAEPAPALWSVDGTATGGVNYANDYELADLREADGEEATA